MLLDVVAPTVLTSPRAYFKLDWITLLGMVIVAAAGVEVLLAQRPERAIGGHLHDDAEPTGAERHVDST